MTKQTNDQSLMLEKLSKPFTKAEWFSYLTNKLTNKPSAPRKIVDLIFEGISEIVNGHVEKGLPVSFIGLVKVYTAEKKPTPARKAPNPFTKEITEYPAKPAHKVVRVKPLKKLKEMVE